MILKNLFIPLTVLLFILQTVAYAQEKAAVPNSPSQTSKTAKGASDRADRIGRANAPEGTPDDSYKIGSGDILAIHLWKEPEISQESVLVRIDGKISFPLLNDVKVAGLTPVQVKTILQEKLADYIETPTVTVIVINPGGQQFYMLGEIARTGAYPLSKNLSVLQALALAGGFSEWASRSEIILLRYENGREKIIRINYKDIIKGKDFSQNLLLKANDTIIVP